MVVTLRGPLATSHNREVPTALVQVLAMCIATPRIPVDRHAYIAEFAYSIAARRGFSPGHELDDWLQAETEMDARLLGEGCAY